MPDLASAVPMSFVIESILIIFLVIGIAIFGVKRAKKAKEEDEKNDT